MATIRKPILVTGSHRSGTSWVGRCLNASPDTGFIWEPFSRSYRPPFMDPPAPCWYLYVAAHNSEQWRGPITETMAFRYPLLRKLRYARSLRDVGRGLRDWWLTGKLRAANPRPLLKDPFALYSSAWFADTFGADIIVTIRHPAGFVSSIMAKTTAKLFQDFLDQPALMDSLLADFRDDVEAALRDELSPLHRGALLWNLTYAFVAKERQAGRPWHFLRHEDIAHDAVGHFRPLYEALELAFTPEVEADIRQRTRPDTTRNWKSRLDDGQVAEIKALTEPHWRSFYTDSDW